MRVVQIEPGPMPTLMASAPQSISALAQLLDAGHGIEHVARVAVRGVDDDQIDAGRDQRFGACEAFVADRGGCGDTQPALLVLAGVRIGDRLLHVLDSNQTDAAVLVIHHQQLLDAVLMQQALGLVLTDALAHGDELVFGHQLGDALARIGRKAHVTVGEDANQFAGAAIGGALNHRHAGNAVLLHQVERLLERRGRLDGERVDHHARLEFLHLAHLRRLLLRLQIAVDYADAAGLRHGDCHLRLGYRVHGGGDDRYIEGDRTGDTGADIDIGGQHFRQTGPDQNVVESEPFARASVVFSGHRQLRLTRKENKTGCRRLKNACREEILARRHGPLLGWRGSLARQSTDS